MKVYFSSHATIKHAEQFPDIDICKELKSAVEIGGQVGKSKAYLCKSNVVVILEKQTIITILTKEHYYANLQSLHINNVDNLSLLKPSSKKEQVRNALIEIIKRHIKESIQNSRLLFRTLKSRHKELIALGYKSHIKYYEELLNENLASIKAELADEIESLEEEKNKKKEQMRYDLLKIIKQHINQDIQNCALCYKTEKQRHKELKELKYSKSQIAYYDQLFDENFAIIKKELQEIRQ